MFFYTCAGATLLMAVCFIIGKLVTEYVKKLWTLFALKHGLHNYTVSTYTSWVACFSGAFRGTYSHVCLDSIYHPNMAPFYPWYSGSEPFDLYLIHNPLQAAIRTIRVIK